VQHRRQNGFERTRRFSGATVGQTFQSAAGAGSKACPTYHFAPRTRIWCLTLLLTAGLVGLHPVPAASANAAPAPPEPVVLRADTAGIVMEWRAPAFSLRQVIGDDGLPYTILEAPGWAQTEEPGQPQLPFASALAVVPPTGDVTLHVPVLERTRRPLPHPVLPARAPVPVGDPPTGVEWAWARDERAYAGTGLHPADAVTLEEVGWLRGRRLVRLTFHPLRFDPAGGALEVVRRVRVELRFQCQPLGTAQEMAASEGGWARNDPFIPVLQYSVINPAQVTRFARPERVTSVPSTSLAGPTAPTLTLADPPAGADYLIIAHSDFIAAVAPLAAHRVASDSLRVFSTTVKAVYDAYSGGQVDPEAIRSYVAHAYNNWTPPRLSYVLLVGDGIEDTLSGSQRSEARLNYIPPYLIVDPWGYKAPSDNRYVTVDGSDNMADVFIGRLPVNTAAEATTIVGKIMAYELNPPQWPWNERVLFFAGHEVQFQQYSDEVYHNHLPSSFTGRRAYFCTSGCNQPHLYNGITAARAAVMQELSTGGLLASYVGHSSVHQWDVDPVTSAPLFHVEDVASLRNSEALPVFLEMTCYTSQFSYRDGDTLDESLLRRAGGGAVATWGPTTLGLVGGHETLHQKFFDAVFQNGITELGAATEAAKAYLRPVYSDLRDTFILLGDPAMDLNLTIVPWKHAVFLPVALRGYH